MCTILTFTGKPKKGRTSSRDGKKIRLSAIEGQYLSVKSAGNLSTLFDIGGIVGGILAGYISDRLKARAITVASFMYAAILAMLLYRTYGHVSKAANIVLGVAPWPT